MKSVDFDRLFPDIQAITNAFRKFRPTVAPELAQLLQGEASPTLQELKEVSAIEPSTDTWGVYLAFLEMEEARARLYTGTGTRLDGGVESRVRNYQHGSALSAKVREFLDLGFEIAHIGIIFSTPTPPAADLRLCRALHRLIEATFTYAFWSVYSVKDTTQYRYVMEGLCFWGRILWSGMALTCRTP
jgi:hypothetical protein